MSRCRDTDILDCGLITEEEGDMFCLGLQQKARDEEMMEDMSLTISR